jgi:hypothetical protein
MNMQASSETHIQQKTASNNNNNDQDSFNTLVKQNLEKILLNNKSETTSNETNISPIVHIEWNFIIGLTLICIGIAIFFAIFICKK